MQYSPANTLQIDTSEKSPNDLEKFVNSGALNPAESTVLR